MRNDHWMLTAWTAVLALPVALPARVQVPAFRDVTGHAFGERITAPGTTPPPSRCFGRRSS